LDDPSFAAAVATMGGVHDLVKFFRANPQALALLVVCVVLGLGTALIVIFGIVASGSTTTTGEPEGLVALGGWCRSAFCGVGVRDRAALGGEFPVRVPRRSERFEV
jgi:hypothetical protein